MSDETIKHAELFEGFSQLKAKIRELEQMEQAHEEGLRLLRESEELYRAVVENVADGIAISVGENRVFVNRAFLTIHGLHDVSQVLGRPLDQFILPEDRELAHYRMTARERGEFVGNVNEYRIRRPNGEVRYVQFTAVLIPYKGQRALLSVLRDITGLKQAEQTIRDLNEELERKVVELQASNRELEAFNYTVSHDLRVPLIAIDGFSRRLLKEYGAQLDDRSSKYLEMIRGGAERMNRFIDDLLAYSRLGRHELATERVSMGALVRSVVEELTAAYPEKRVEVTIGELPDAKGDRVLLRQVVLNLLSNAFKFTGTDGQALIEIGTTAVPGGIAYYVRDNGIGFSMDDHDKLFDVFRRLHGSHFEGTGIGLAIVKRGVERHGGRVWAEGDPGGGATFFFTLPLFSGA